MTATVHKVIFNGIEFLVKLFINQVKTEIRMIYWLDAKEVYQALPAWPQEFPRNVTIEAIQTFSTPPLFMAP